MFAWEEWKSILIVRIGWLILSWKILYLFYLHYINAKYYNNGRIIVKLFNFSGFYFINYEVLFRTKQGQWEQDDTHRNHQKKKKISNEWKRNHGNYNKILFIVVIRCVLGMYRLSWIGSDFVSYGGFQFVAKNL